MCHPSLLFCFENHNLIKIVQKNKKKHRNEKENITVLYPTKSLKEY